MSEPLRRNPRIAAIVKRAGLVRYATALTQRELAEGYRRIEKRLLQCREPFGVFIVRAAGGRRIRLFTVGSSEFEANLRRDVWLRHMVGTYDKTAELDSILTDLMEFAR